MSKIKQFNPVSQRDFELTNGFFKILEEKIENVTMPWSYAQLKESGRIEAFRLEWKEGSSIPKPHYFWDSDVAKWVESAALILQRKDNPELKEKMEYVVDLIIGSQQPDGYLNIYFTVVEPDKRWYNMRDCHELYCAGHLIEAAVEHYKATKNRKFLDAMCKYVDYIDSVFGTEEGKKRGYCGHEEIKLALMKLYYITNDEKHLNLAKYFMEERGQDPLYFNEEAVKRGEKTQPLLNLNDPHPDILGYGADFRYFQAHLPVREQDEAVGHAVRLNYLFTGVADLGLELGDRELICVCNLIWQDISSKKMYITGGIGQTRKNEGFMKEYFLPNHEAYAETCAAISFAFLSHRLLQTVLNSKFSDTIELEMYNGILAALSTKGDTIFYENPLALDISKRKHHREDWFRCSCCPNNFTRFYAAIHQYILSVSNDNKLIAIHQYISVKGTINLDPANTSPNRTDSNSAEIEIDSGFPWNGNVGIKISTKNVSDLKIALRIPGWCSEFAIILNGKNITAESKAKIMNGYLILSEKWDELTTINIEFEMRTRIMRSHPKVQANLRKVAFARGPLIYCYEQNEDPEDLVFKTEGWITEQLVKNDLGQYVEILVKAEKAQRDPNQEALYSTEKPKKSEISVPLIPYYLWANRGDKYMAVWLNEKD